MASESKSSGVVPAEPLQWSEASQRSISFHYTKEYRDIEYACWRCKSKAVFSAADQKYTYEVRKAPIDQQRILCQYCWHQSQAIAQDINNCEANWAAAKLSLGKDKEFLSRWFQLLVTREEYVPYRENTSAKNMLQKLLKKLA